MLDSKKSYSRKNKAGKWDRKSQGWGEVVDVLSFFTEKMTLEYQCEGNEDIWCRIYHFEAINRKVHVPEVGVSQATHGTGQTLEGSSKYLGFLLKEMRSHWGFLCMGGT